MREPAAKNYARDGNRPFRRDVARNVSSIQEHNSKSFAFSGVPPSVYVK